MAGLLPGYSSTIADAASKKRYAEKLELVDGIDPYEVAKGDWRDDVDLWPAITQLQVCMYLILAPSPYSEKDFLNYKSLDCYQNFVRGWVRQVLVKPVRDKRIVIGKVNCKAFLNKSNSCTVWVN